MRFPRRSTTELPDEVLRPETSYRPRISLWRSDHPLSSRSADICINTPISCYVAVVAATGHGSQSFFFCCAASRNSVPVYIYAVLADCEAYSKSHTVPDVFVWSSIPLAHEVRSTPNGHFAHPYPSTEAFLHFNNSRGLLYLHTGDDLPSGISCISPKPSSPIHGSLRVACRR
ncbi:uncharacterized protein EURHEDRAFT_345325 [Aspergillus ruber CBS 135680]|uniref:Uncharacterized protein n=1 Tax=Aspergillus ruber (strain CBS 135680) TaxID=1388766 RepID=A0A017SJM1_ASPRC|nr:uncharacterized protein EURHEDRAFT_345325 [Aspergillus ruber CBS 135680]EYE96966.1 hypothetical protein EURHEDRAFT_345325 [Aspergillus ruber CBS 135680]